MDECKDFYPDAQDMISSHIKEYLGKYVMIKSYMGSNHVSKMANKMSNSVIIVYVNNAPIICCRKLQNKV